MSDQIDPTSETPANDAPRAWTDPTCTEYAVADLTAAGMPFGNSDGASFS